MMKSVIYRYNKNPKDFGGQLFSGQNWKKFKQCAYGRKIFLFGAGKTCEEFLEEYEGKIAVSGIFENDESKCTANIRGIKVISAKKITQYNMDEIVILISSTQYDDEIGQQLKELGVIHIFSVYALVSKEQFGWKKKIYNKLFAYHFGILTSHSKFYNYIVFHVLAILRVIHFPPAYLPYKGLQKYKNRHKGERCVIVATGPSLNIEDLELLRKNNVITFSMNSIFNIFEKTDWRPDYYVIEDPKFNQLFDWSDEKYNLDCICKDTAFLTSMYRKTCKNFRKVQFYPISFLGHLMEPGDTHMMFSKNFIWGIYCAYTVTNVCIQLAQYMGFSKVYLLGVDCNYSGEQKHFAKEKDDHKYTERYAKQVYENLVRGYTYIGRKMQQYGTTVYNATRGGMLEVFERIELEDILEEGQ